MPHKIKTMDSFTKDFKSFKKDKALQVKILEHVDTIVEKPLEGVFLSGNLAGLRKYRLVYHNHYRILYRVYDCCNQENDVGVICQYPSEDIADADCTGLVQLLHVQTRQDADNLYKKKKKDVEKSLLDGFNITT